jgi:positive regulator of sigma E activity
VCLVNTAYIYIKAIYSSLVKYINTFLTIKVFLSLSFIKALFIIINKVLGLVIGYKISLFKENLKLRREEDSIILRAYKVTLNTTLSYRFFN